MMRRAVAVLAMLSLSACSDYNGTPVAAYRRWQDRLVASTHIPFFGLKPVCSTRWIGTKNVGAYEMLPLDQCFKFNAPKRMKGLWRNDFEGSRFCPPPASECSYGMPGEKIWLDFSFGATDTKPRKWRVPPGGLYAVDFIGRATPYRGSYGHMGTNDRLMLVDRMISVREVEPPPTGPEQGQVLK